MAVKQAAKESSQDTGRAIAGFWHHRLLCRVFADGNRSFVLKGGHAMLARTVDARATRDIDLLSTTSSLDRALEDLKRLALRDLDDFVTFEFIDARPIKTADEYRSGLTVRFACLLGARKVHDVSIDLVVDEVTLEDVDVVTPLDRLDIRGVDTCDYCVYPIDAVLADKLCGIIEPHAGRPSSRVKDLVDVLVVISSMGVDGDRLASRIDTELSVRKLVRPQEFHLPAHWNQQYSVTYAVMSKRAHLPDAAAHLNDAQELAQKLFNPALDATSRGKEWNWQARAWEPKEPA